MSALTDGAEDSGARGDELEALAAIFGADFELLPFEMGAVARVAIALESETAKAALEARLPRGYPSQVKPEFAVKALAGVSEALRRQLTETAAAAAARAPAGAPCVFEVVEAVRARLEAAPAAAAAAAPVSQNDASFTFHPACPQYGQRPVRFDSASADEKYAVPIVEGEPVVDRKSTFKAYLATNVDSDEKVQWARRNILGRKNVAKATHNMLAYRFVDGDGISHADNDDDGEDGAGAKMAYVLSVLNADNCLVIVARWYGGIKLGPDRFKHIAKCTQRILEANGVGRRNN